MKEIKLQKMFKIYTYSSKSKNPLQFTGILCFVLVYATPGFLVTGAYTLMGRRLWAVRPPFDDQQGMISVQQVNQYIII